MTMYSVHIRNAGTKPDLVCIQDGFSWGAAVFGFIWALYLGAWGVAGVLLVVQILVGALIPLLIADATAQGLAHIGLAVVIGFSANELRRVVAGAGGLDEVGVVTGADIEDAERRYLDTHPEATQHLLGALA